MSRKFEVDFGTCPAPVTQAGQRPILKSAIVIACAGLVVYLNSFQGVFLYDDEGSIVSNEAIRHLWPPWPCLTDPINVTRPLIGFLNALNYAVSGLSPWSYHAVNLTIHVAAALALFGIVRRTLNGRALSPRFGKNSTPLAVAVSLIWMVHPLQTESVTYVIQRCESAMGMFYLITLYCSIRSFESNRKGLWYGAAIAACAGGMMSKQVMVTAPVMVLLYDFIFEERSVKKALSERWLLYAGLAATWSVLAITIIAAPASNTAGFGLKSLSSWEYCKSQLVVIVYYLRLSLWPSPLCFDYFGWPKAQTAAQIAPLAAVIAGVASGTLWAVIRRKPAGFLGAWFFLILLPTSSLLPIQDPIYEHRMYLPLASVVALVVLGCYLQVGRFLDRLPVLMQQKDTYGRISLALVTLIVAILGVATARRNVDYSSELAMWADVVRKRPDNARAHNNLGTVFLNRGRTQEAIDQFAEALSFSPNYAYAHYNLGAAMITMGNLDQAKLHLIEAARLNPHDYNAHFNLGAILGVQGHTDVAIQEFSRALQIKPDSVEAHQQLGVALENQGRLPEAKEQYRIALRFRPNWQELEDHLAGLQ